MDEKAIVNMIVMLCFDPEREGSASETVMNHVRHLDNLVFPSRTGRVCHFDLVLDLSTKDGFTCFHPQREESAIETSRLRVFKDQGSRFHPQREGSAIWTFIVHDFCS